MKIAFILIMFSSPIFANDKITDAYSSSLAFAQVTDVITTQKTDGSWCFHTSVKHNDEGWEHYANGWEITDLNGKKIGYRLLAHPHVNEQPFTRSLCNVTLPPEIQQVIIRAKCNAHGYGGKSVIVDLKRSRMK